MKTLTILFVLTSHAMLGDKGKPTGVWFEELSTPYYALVDAGYNVEIVSIDGGAVPIDPKSKKAIGENPASVDRFLKDDAAMKKITTTSSVADIKADQYAAVFLPGGHGTMWDLPNSKPLANLLGKAMDEGKVVAAVCHGPAGLVNATLKNGDSIVKGRKVSAFTNEEEDAVGLTE
ncbi:MAG: type 1 glutamine amidotransferase domain-containing protein, partial [Methylophilaceae bacterium]